MFQILQKQCIFMLQSIHISLCPQFHHHMAPRFRKELKLTSMVYKIDSVEISK